MDCGRRCGRRRRAAVLGLAGLLACGCQVFRPGSAAPGAPGPLGQISDQVFLAQETNAEASDFVLYDHEFIGSTVRLNTGGEDHLKQIAARVRAGAPFPVIVERTMAGVNPQDEYALPVQPDPELDGRRRELVVRALTALGVAEAEQRVVVAPALAPGFDDQDIEQNIRTLQRGGRFGGFGGFGGIGGGFGGIGGFGGGFR